MCWSGWVVAPARAVMAWGTPVVVNSSSGEMREEGDYPRVAVNGAGAAVAVWEGFLGSNGLIVGGAVRQASSSRWSYASLGADHFDDALPRVAIDDAGNVIVVFANSSSLQGGIKTQLASANGQFGAPISLSAPGQGAGEPEIAMNGSGDAVVGWESQGAAVQVALRPRGAAFTAPVTVSAAGVAVSSPRVAINRRGDAIVVWEQNGIVMASVGRHGSPFGAPAVVSGSGASTMDPHVALDDAGDALVVWQRGHPGRIQVASAPAGGGFGTASDLSPVAGNASGPRLAMSATGEAVIAWQLGARPRSSVQAAVGTAGRGFGAPFALSGSGTDPEVASDPAGDSVVAWTDNSTKTAMIRAAVRSPSGTFGPSVAVAAAGDAEGEPQVAVGSGKDAILVWAAWDKSGHRTVYESDYAPAPSITRLTITPRTFVAASRGASVARASGALVQYTDTQSATTTFFVLSSAPGVSVAGRCVASRGRRHGRPCVRYVSIGSFVRHDHAGLNQFRFTGRVRGRRVPPGAYRLQALPRNLGRTGAPVSALFRITR
ncbi:MAG TPA: hypothetical protein VMU39_00740 [Solirubrobacteraceae bacterium]|nr:hypothetical protein [Solirubrobacteraceae bacterium]